MQDETHVILSGAEIDVLSSTAEERALDAGDVVFRRGEPGGQVFVLLEGSIELRFGEEKRPKTLGPGSLFGELAALLPEMLRSADAVALESTRIATWDAAAVESLTRSDPAALLGIVVRSCRYLIASEDALIDTLQRRNTELERTLDYLRRTREELSAKEILAQSDPLTGLYNRRCLHKQLPRFAERADETGATMVLLMGDLDGFKSINDLCGHAEGDLMLVRVAGLVAVSIRRTDLACRMGGDEFAVMLPEITLDDARAIADRLIAHVATLSSEHAGEVLPLTLSIGAVVYRRGESLDMLMKRADERLYAAKAGGGDQVVWEVEQG
jgi:diguanylate cyclase (GGDEF)-like protein